MSEPTFGGRTPVECTMDDILCVIQPDGTKHYVPACKLYRTWAAINHIGSYRAKLQAGVGTLGTDATVFSDEASGHAIAWHLDDAIVQAHEAWDKAIVGARKAKERQ